MPFNQPKLCPSATWNSSGITFADNITIGMNSRSVFIDANNTVYVTNFENGHIQVWLEGSPNVTGTIITNSTKPYALFVSAAGNIYVDNGNPYKQVDAWREGTNIRQSTLFVGGSCYGLFIDSNNSLYCSMHNSHQVIKRSLNSSVNQTSIVAGTGCIGYQAYALYNPSGIFVTNSTDLYVADTGNDRIQLFRAGQVNGTTVAGREASGTIQLSSPTAVILDADRYLFIVDCSNHKIVRSGPGGFWCVIGCTSGGVSALGYPQSMAFDSYGNIFVADNSYDRVQKFILSSNSCSE